MTRGDKLRSMTDEQIVDVVFDIGIDDYFDFCQNRYVCSNTVDNIPEEWYKKCMLEWLQKED